MAFPFSVISEKQPIEFEKGLFLADSVVLQDRLFVVGEQGAIFSTSDATHWNKLNSPANRLITSINSDRNKVLVAAGHDAAIFLSEDSGESWNMVYEDIDYQAPILDIIFIDKNHLIAIGAYGLYLTSHDAGQTWQSVPMALPDYEVTDENDWFDPNDLHLNSITVSEDKNVTVIAAESGYIFLSTDKGARWRVLKSPYNGSFFGVEVLSDNSILAYGLRGNIYKYNMYTGLWKKIESNTNELLHASFYDKKNNIAIVGYGSTILFSEDNAETFIKKDISSKSNFSSISKKDNRYILTHENGIFEFNGR